MNHRFLILAAVLGAGFVTPPGALGLSPKGTWKVTTTLVTASDAVNPDYNPGDKRAERWKITVWGAGGRRSTLTTPAGKITGKRVGKAWQYLGVYPLTAFDVNLRVKVELVLRQTSAKRIQGTNEVGYYDPRYARGGSLYDPQAEAGAAIGVWDPELGAKLGQDAYSFRGRR